MAVAPLNLKEGACQLLFGLLQIKKKLATKRASRVIWNADGDTWTEAEIGHQILLERQGAENVVFATLLFRSWK